MTDKSNNPRHAVLCVVSLATVASTPGLGWAADVSSPENSSVALSEVVVTADKRGEESIQSIPTTIQAISGDTLERTGAVEFSDFSGQVAGLTYDDLGPGDKKYVIRGITSTGPATVGVYYDEAVITGSNSNDGGGRQPDIRLFDLDRIEVLKGPQGTLYGASSMSGTIRYITKKPVLDRMEGYIHGEGSSTSEGGGNYNFNGALNLPVVNGVLALRLVGWDVQNSGFIDDIRIPAGPVDNANWEKTEGGRALLRWVPMDALDVVASATVQTLKTGGSARYTPPGVLSFGDSAATPAPGYPRVLGGDLKNTDLTLSPWDENMQIFGLTANYTTPVGVVTATTNYFNRRVDFNFDSTPILFFFGVPIPGITQEPQNRRIVSSELRYASKLDFPVNFVMGGFSQREHNDFTVHVIKSNLFGVANGPFSGLNSDDALTNPDGNTFFGRYDNNIIKQYAAFGEVTWQATEQLSALLGVRYFHSSQESFQAQTHPFGGFSGSPVGEQTNSFAGNKTTFKANVSYKTDLALLYATVSEGFRVGGTNAADLPFASNIPRTYNPDQLRNYELGVKSEFLDRRVRLNAAAYAIRWSDIQIQSLDTTGAFPFVTNGGTASVDGFELELQTLLAPGLELDLTGTYENARLTSDQPNDCFNKDGTPCNPNVGFNGDVLQEVPKFLANAALSYSVPLAADLTANFRADVQYRDATKTQTNPLSKFSVPLAPYTLLNLRAGVDWNEWNATFFVKNVTDKRAQVDAISSDQDPLAYITVRPRTIGGTITRKF
jgi:outer membrane receptor protein involved in Fe transport